MKMGKLIFSLLFIFSIENLHSINYEELKTLSNDSVRNLFTTYLDSSHFDGSFYYMIDNVKDRLTKKDFEKKPLTEHEKKRIEFLVSARYEDWELERKVNYKYYKSEIDEAIEKDSVLKTLKDTAAITHRKKEIIDFQIAKYKEKRQTDDLECSTNVVRMILKFDWKEFIPLLEDVYKKTMAKECRCHDIDQITYVLARWHVEPYHSDCIRKYGYDEKKQDVENYRLLEAIGSPAAIYELTKALRSKKKDYLNDIKDEYVRNRYLFILGDERTGVEGFPFNIDDLIDVYIEKYNSKDPDWKYLDEFLYKESEKEIDKIMQWVEENKETLHFKE